MVWCWTIFNDQKEKKVNPEAEVGKEKTLFTIHIVFPGTRYHSPR